LGPEFALDLSGCPAHDGSVTGHADDSLTMKIGSIAKHAARSARRIEADAWFAGSKGWDRASAAATGGTAGAGSW
jgi:hypothetical protein